MRAGPELCALPVRRHPSSPGSQVHLGLPRSELAVRAWVVLGLAMIGDSAGTVALPSPPRGTPPCTAHDAHHVRTIASFALVSATWRLGPAGRGRDATYQAHTSLSTKTHMPTHKCLTK